MPPTDEKKSFVEVRLFVTERDGKPSDLSLVKGSLSLVPKEGKPLKRDLQLMMPEPPLSPPSVDPVRLPDGHQVRVAVQEFGAPFQVDKPADSGAGSVYLKADVPAELARKDVAATLMIHFPTGKHLVELRPLFKS